MKKRAFSLIEVLLATGIMGLIVAGATSISTMAARGLVFTSNQHDADMSASYALMKLSRELQEATSVEIVSSTRIRVKYLQVDVNGDYIRGAIDNVNTVDFFRGNTDFTPNVDGNCLVFAPATGTGRVICRYVTGLSFSSLTSSSIDVTLRTEFGGTNSKRRCDMVHRAIFLRNYQ
jgi:prepilin-type N-terminal cleavage/methylation domain-containing protein